MSLFQILKVLNAVTNLFIRLKCHLGKDCFDGSPQKELPPSDVYNKEGSISSESDGMPSSSRISGLYLH